MKKMKKIIRLTESDIERIVQRIIKEGEEWIGSWSANNNKELVKKLEDIFSNNGNGASFSYNEKDFTITKSSSGNRFLITSGTDWKYEALNLNGAVNAIHKFSNGILPNNGLQNENLKN